MDFKKGGQPFGTNLSAPPRLEKRTRQRKARGPPWAAGILLSFSSLAVLALYFLQPMVTSQLLAVYNCRQTDVGEVPWVLAVVCRFKLPSDRGSGIGAEKRKSGSQGFFLSGDCENKLTTTSRMMTLVVHSSDVLSFSLSQEVTDWTQIDGPWIAVRALSGWILRWNLWVICYGASTGSVLEQGLRTEVKTSSPSRSSYEVFVLGYPAILSWTGEGPYQEHYRKGYC